MDVDDGARALAARRVAPDEGAALALAVAARVAARLDRVGELNRDEAERRDGHELLGLRHAVAVAIRPREQVRPRGVAGVDAAVAVVVEVGERGEAVLRAPARR